MRRNPSPQEMAAKLLGEGGERFDRSGPLAHALSDPIVDTIIEVTLDELRPYDHNPRITRNPFYDEIKTSIRERGLDAPPPITRRPGEPHYIIRNGGNTRLAVLQELWGETRDAQFFRFKCLYRPWPMHGEIVALSGHLAENELHGRLTFIERALGVEKLREFYEQETGEALSQSELARRLKTSGYPVGQPVISRMQGTIQYLLPTIPNVLYGGLGRPHVDQLLSLRQSAAQLWCAHAGNTVDDFAVLFRDVLSAFDVSQERFSVDSVKDKFIERMAEELGTSYDTLTAGILYFDKYGANEAANEAIPSFLLEPPHAPPEPSHSPPEPPKPDVVRASAALPTPATARNNNDDEAQTAWDATGAIASDDPQSLRVSSIHGLIEEHAADGIPSD